MKLHVAGMVIASALMLQGCVGAFVVAGTAVATSTATDPRSVGTQVDDTTLAARVTTAIGKDQQIKQETHIVVTAYQGKILLTGQTPNPDLAVRAKQIAKGTEGVVDVFNEMRTGQPATFSTASSDTWISTKLRSQLLTSDAVKSSNVKVTTENGEVFLMGLVTEKEGNAAAEIASKISGVKHVTKAFSYVR